MGTVFSLYKRKPKQRYELGKHRLGYAPGLAPPEKTLIQKLAELHKAWKATEDTMANYEAYYMQKMKINDPGWTAMWSIMGTPNYSVFKMSRWSREELADKLYRASSWVTSPEIALKVADHLLAWAGDDDVTLNPEEPQELAELGWPIRGYRDATSIWEALKQ